MVWCAACGGNVTSPQDGGSVDAPSCPNNLPSMCPSPAPAYASVAGILQANCGPCHQPGGVGAPRYYNTYAEVFSQRQPVLDQVYACRMPPADAGQLTSEERSEILAWMVCGAPM